MVKRLSDVITLGSATRDVFLPIGDSYTRRRHSAPSGAVLEFPLGAKIDLPELIFETGGGATNTAVGFARLGFRTAFIGRIGAHDTRGRAILETLEHEGVDTSLVIRDPRRMTAYSLLLLTSRGERTIFVYRGASAEFRRSEIPWRRLNARWLYVTSLSGNLSVLRAVLDHARRRRINVAFNPGAKELALGPKRLLPLLRSVDILLVNREEAARLAGVAYDRDRATLRRLCLALPGIVVITEGARGAVVCDAYRQYLAATHRIALVNTTGAGDAFGCGFVAGYLRFRGDVRRALQLATANAESVIRHIGAKRGLLHRFPSPRQSVAVRAVRFPNA